MWHTIHDRDFQAGQKEIAEKVFNSLNKGIFVETLLTDGPLSPYSSISVVAVKVVYWDVAAYLYDDGGVDVLTYYEEQGEYQEAQLARCLDNALSHLPCCPKMQQKPPGTILTDVLSHWQFGQDAMAAVQRYGAAHSLAVVVLGTIQVLQSDEKPDTICSMFTRRPKLHPAAIAAILRQVPSELG